MSMLDCGSGLANRENGMFFPHCYSEVPLGYHSKLIVLKAFPVLGVIESQLGTAVDGLRNYR